MVVVKVGVVVVVVVVQVYKKREVATKLWRAFVAYKKSFQDIEIFTRQGRAGVLPGGRPGALTGGRPGVLGPAANTTTNNIVNRHANNAPPVARGQGQQVSGGKSLPAVRAPVIDLSAESGDEGEVMEDSGSLDEVTTIDLPATAGMFSDDDAPPTKRQKMCDVMVAKVKEGDQEQVLEEGEVGGDSAVVSSVEKAAGELNEHNELVIEEEKEEGLVKEEAGGSSYNTVSIV